MSKNTLIIIMVVTLLTIAFALGIAIGNNAIDDFTGKEKEITVYELLLRTREN